MKDAITGIHHVTAIATHPQQNVDFYAGVLGLRLVKKTVNFDDPSTYHFYYGDGSGHPGTILTFFPWPSARRGSRGSGQATVTSFSVPEGSLDFWSRHFAELGILAEEPKARFDEEVLSFYDPDGLKLELVAHGDIVGEPWDGGSIPAEHAIRGFHSVTLTEQALEPTQQLLTEVMAWRLVGQAGNRYRFEAPTEADAKSDGIARRLDIVHKPDTGFGRIAAGTVHHIAWRVADESAQVAWSDRLVGAGLYPSEIKERQYFKSIYFREPGGVLFEFATDVPGFLHDEEFESLGHTLKLPPWLEPHRESIEGVLPPIQLPAIQLPVIQLPKKEVPRAEPSSHDAVAVEAGS